MSFVPEDLDAKCTTCGNGSIMPFWDGECSWCHLKCKVCGSSWACPHRHSGGVKCFGRGVNMMHLDGGVRMHIRVWMQRIYLERVEGNPEAEAPQQGGWQW